MQLGLAIENPKATLAVKRRLACEMIKCWKQVTLSVLSYHQDLAMHKSIISYHNCDLIVHSTTKQSCSLVYLSYCSTG